MFYDEGLRSHPVLSTRNSQHCAFDRLQLVPPMLPSSARCGEAVAAQERLNSVHAWRDKEIITDSY